MEEKFMETKTEKLKPNEVAAPTLFVGVGGTGCKIIKKVADLCAPEEKASTTCDGPHFFTSS